MNKRMWSIILVVLVIASITLGACAQATPVPTTVAAPTQAPSPTAATLGTADNPIIVAFEPSATSQEITAGGQELLDQLSAETGLTFKGVIPTSYAALTEAMGSGNAQIGWMATFAYILAHQKGFADVALITNRFGSDHYGAQFIARADAGFTPAADVPATDAEISTLLQFIRRNLRGCAHRRDHRPAGCDGQSGGNLPDQSLDPER